MSPTASSWHHRRKKTTQDVNVHERDRDQSSMDYSSGGTRHASRQQERRRMRHGGGGGGVYHCLLRGTRGHVVTLILGVLLGYILLPFILPDNPVGSLVVESSRGTVEEKKISVREFNYWETDLPWKRNPTVLRSHVEQRLVDSQNLLARESLPTRTTPVVMKTPILPDHQRKKILVTGGAGFVGSHLVDKLMMEGHEVTVIDNFFTGQRRNIEHWLQHPNFSLRIHDVTEPLELEIDEIYHLACPASPPHYQYNPVKTIKTSTQGTLHMLGLAKRTKARILLASTSEVYGDPKVHPQSETYWGNVNTIGPRACYDEGKRVAETMMYSYRNQRSAVQVRVARIFNTFGPRMHPNDGRVVSNFIIQALQNKNITIYGHGQQTRSFQYVSDLVEGLHSLMNSDYDQPVNLGNPTEYSIRDFAMHIKYITGSEAAIINLEKAEDDPQQRKPDISVARRELGWEPKVKVEDGLKQTIKYFQRVLEEAGEIIPTGPGAHKPEA